MDQDVDMVGQNVDTIGQNIETVGQNVETMGQNIGTIDQNLMDVRVSLSRPFYRPVANIIIRNEVRAQCITDLIPLLTFSRTAEPTPTGKRGLSRRFPCIGDVSGRNTRAASVGPRSLV
jgi:hypothetical protein